MTQHSEQYNLAQALGHLFYAVAVADKQVKPREIVALKAMLQSEWTDSESDTTTPLEIKNTFDRLNTMKTPAIPALDVFITFQNENPDLFSIQLKEQIWKTVNTITESIGGKNKSELNILSRLSVLLDA